MAKRQGANMEKLKEFADSQKKGEFYNFEQGETLVYIHPPCREDDDHEPTNGMNFIPVAVHYGIGKAKVAISLDPVDNPIIEHPFIKDALKKRRKKIKLTGKCPIKAQLEGDDWTDEEVDAAKLQMKFFWGITPVGFRKSRKKRFVDLDDGPCVCMANATINSGFMDAMLEYDDVSNPDEAVLVRVKRTGTGMNSKYEVTIDPETAHTPKAFSAKEKKRLFAAMENQCDLFSVVANMIRSPEEIQSLIYGVSSDDDDDEDDDAPPPKKSKKTSKKSKAPPPDDDDDDEDEDDDEEDEEDEEDDDPPTKKSKSKSKKSKPVDDDDDDDEDDDEDDEEDESPKKSKKKTSKKSKAPPPDDDDDDEDEDDDEDDEDDDEEPQQKKSSKKKSPPKKSPPKKSKSEDDEDEGEDEDDDVDVGDLNAELNEIGDDDDDEDDEEDESPKKSKKTSKSKSKSKRSKK